MSNKSFEICNRSLFRQNSKIPRYNHNWVKKNIAGKSRKRRMCQRINTTFNFVTCGCYVNLPIPHFTMGYNIILYNRCANVFVFTLFLPLFKMCPLTVNVCWAMEWYRRDWYRVFTTYVHQIFSPPRSRIAMTRLLSWRTGNVSILF